MASRSHQEVRVLEHQAAEGEARGFAAGEAFGALEGWKRLHVVEQSWSLSTSSSSACFAIMCASP
jgi:hypothetical protein